jgi:predicted RNA-binding Zn-ribbon protein involved in translation (DUF1610 family)
MRESDWEDDEGEDDLDDDKATDLCPNCGEEIYDDAEQCPHCGHYITEEDHASRKSWWVVAGAVICLAIAVWWLISAL